MVRISSSWRVYSLAYSTGKSIRGIVHIVNPALMGNRCNLFSLLINIISLLALTSRRDARIKALLTS